MGANFHCRLSKRLDLKWVFCLEAERVVSNDWGVRYENRFLQLKPRRNQGLGAGARVTVQQARDGELRVVFGGRAVVSEEIAKPPRKARMEPKQREVSHPSPRPLEITRAIPTFPQPRRRRFLSDEPKNKGTLRLG